MTSAPSWDRDRHGQRRPMLLQRNRIKEAIRSWFASENFTEVETPALQISPGNETHLHAFETRILAGDGQSAPMFLRTSPEFAAKKLLSAGEDRIFEFATAYRNRDRTHLHAPEFTMLEWYRTGETYEQVMSDVVSLIREAANAAGVESLTHDGAAADAFATPLTLTTAEAFDRLAAIDLPATLDEDGSPRRDALANAAKASGIRIAEDDDWSDIFSRVMAERIEPRLGSGQPTLLIDYPAPEAALARPKRDDPRFAERFEVFVAGVELANGFGELTDAEEQRRRFVRAMDEKDRLYGERYPIDEDFLLALDHMPDAAGVALGFDRLVMLCVGAERIDQVQWMPVANPLPGS